MPTDKTQFCGVRDAPIPSTDQVLSVVVDSFGGEGALNKYYVPPGGVVVAWKKTPTDSFELSSRGVGRGRSVANKVYKVTSSYHEMGTELADDTLKTPVAMAKAIADGQFRVFGVAYDGISVANASLAQDPKNRDATGRFSSIFTGVATVSMPFKTGKTPSMAMSDARIGDVVVVNPFVKPEFNFKGDPEGYTGYGLAIVKRSDWMTLVGGGNEAIRALFFNTFDENKSGGKLDNSKDAVLGDPDDDVTAQIKKIFGACCLGYVLATGGAARNEVTVQLDLNSQSRYWGCMGATAPADITKEQAKTAAAKRATAAARQETADQKAKTTTLQTEQKKWKESYTAVVEVAEEVQSNLTDGVNEFKLLTKPVRFEDGSWDAEVIENYITGAKALETGVTTETAKVAKITDADGGGLWTITADNATAGTATGMIDVGAPMISTGGSLKRKRGAFAEVVEAETAGMLGDDRSGDPCQSLLGLVGGAVASDSVGTVLYSTMDPATAARVLATAPATEVGLTPAGRGIPGTFAGEMLGTGNPDPQSSRKIAARAEYLESLCGHSLPRSIDGIDPKTMSWGVSPTVETALKGTPDAVIQALATHGDNGHSIPSSRLVSAWVDATQYRPTAAADGASLAVYGDMPNAVQFQTIHLPEAMDVVRGSGKAVHNLSADSQQRILTAAAKCLRGNE